ncbi:MAG: TetR/AcrR family transcriptional regulator [Cyclobacteriaceae bacterium]
MNKAATTRQHIIAEAAKIFNVKGYSGASISDVMASTGLKKGGIYNHFANKEELTVEAFNHAFDQMQRQFVEVLTDERPPLEQLTAFVEVFRSFIYEPPIKGGCPILNSSVEVDDQEGALALAVKKAARSWEIIIQRKIEEAITLGDIPGRVDPRKQAVIMISALEGAILLAKLHKEAYYLQVAADHQIDLIHQMKTSTEV